MEIIRCERGHFYDAEQCSSCPTCAKEGFGSYVNPGVFESVPETLPVNQGFDVGATTPLNQGFDLGATLPLNYGAAPVNPANDIGSTMPLQSGVGGFQFPGAGQGEDYMGKTLSAYDSPNQDKGIDFYSQTTPITPGGITGPQGKPFNPVVGWLVCTEGPGRGTDYRIFSQYNYIGRAKHMDICIPDDQTISAERAAVIAYDTENKVFFVGPGMGHSTVRLNGNMMMGSERLNAYDVITIGSSKFVFVPLCGDKFNWNR